jgi:hypothetical protein
MVPAVLAPVLRGSARWLTACALLCWAIACSAVARADAPSEEGAAVDTSAPPLPHYLATWSAGVPLRLSKDEKFDQGTLAPVYTDLLAGYVFAGHGTIRHGAALGFSLNLTEDGGFTEPVRMYDQFVVMPAYVMMFDLAPELFSFAHAGIPINLHAGTTVGLELAFAIGYRLLSGFGVFAETSLDTFVGAGSSYHPLLAIEGGVFIDFEVLP